MIEFQPRRDAGAPTLVEQAVDAVVRAIESHALGPGMALPSVREFARAYGISTFTVASAYGRLVAQGWLDARRGSGYRVAARGRPPGRGVPQSWQPPQLGAGWLLSDIFADHSIPIKAGCGWLPPEWVNETGLHQALRHQSRVPAVQVGGYGHPYGYAPLREQVAGALAELGMQVEPDQVLMTQGATQGLDLVVRTLLKPGDAVLVESPCYTNLLQMLRLAGMRIVAVPRGAQGVDLAALAQAAQDSRPRALFVNTVLHNPTGTTLGMAQAFRLLQLAEHHRLWVVEDDISRPLLSGPAPALAALDGGNRVIYVGGYSKSISPSMRVGYVAAQRDLVRDLVRTKMAVGLTSSEVIERLVHHVVREGQYRAHTERVRERLMLAHGQAAARMQALGMQVLAQPQAGLFLWARAPGPAGQGANRLAEAALRDGIWLAPGSYFDAQERDVDWLRFNVAYTEAPALWRFLEGACRGGGGAPAA
ncbi:PLP-dependent aminotransferase family protein [Orrella sp. JC864]|uniref:aminotransferase-like domain-containing protein n=1 Tax=Orrella sp. JC864 TaxID=3120298 RepID=UPI00300B0C5A